MYMNMNNNNNVRYRE